MYPARAKPPNLVHPKPSRFRKPPREPLSNRNHPSTTVSAPRSSAGIYFFSSGQLVPEQPTMNVVRDTRNDGFEKNGGFANLRRVGRLCRVGRDYVCPWNQDRVFRSKLYRVGRILLCLRASCVRRVCVRRVSVRLLACAEITPVFRRPSSGYPISLSLIERTFFAR